MRRPARVAMGAAPVTVAAAAALLGLPAPALARDGDLQAMVPLARLLEGIPHRAAVAGSSAFLALDTGIAVYDISDPKRPARVSHLYLPSPALDIEVLGARLLVANGESGLAVVDVADPARPLLVGSLATPGARAVAVAGSVAYLAESRAEGASLDGLRTVDLSQPSSPLALGFVPLPSGALDVAVDGAVAFVALGSELGGEHGLHAIDVSDPSAPVAIAGGVYATGRAVHEVVLAAGLAWLATGFSSTGAVLCVDVSAPAAPRLVSSVALGDGASGLALEGSTLFVAARALGLLSFDVADPTTPRMLDALPTLRESVSVALTQGFALLSERASIERAALTVVDRTFPGNLAIASLMPFAEATATAATAVAGLARGYFLERDALWIADTSVPGLPTWLGVWRPASGDFSALSVEGTLAAVSEGRAVHLIDLVDPASPRGLGTAELAAGVAVVPVLAGNTLHVVNGHGLESFDVSSPGAPVPLATFRTTEWSSALAVDGTLGALVAGPTLHVLDLSASAAPLEIGRVSVTGERLYGVDVKGSLAVATGFSATLHVFDLSQPAAPVWLATLPGPGGFDVRLAGDRAVVAAGESGLRVADLRAPAAPLLEAYFDSSGTALKLAVDGRSVLLASNEAQHWLVHCESCAQACIDSWPLVRDNSLKGVGEPGAAVFSWELQAGSGEFNLHRTGVKAELPALYLDAGKRVGTSAALVLRDDFAPGTGECGYYKIYPRASCSGASVGP